MLYFYIFFQVVFNDYIRPVCLPSVDRSYNGHNTTVVGWGKLSEVGDMSMSVARGHT